MKNFAAKITWAWGLKEVKVFSTAQERLDFLRDLEDDIYTCTFFLLKNHVLDTILGGLSSIERNMTDYEEDMYL